jgi:flagellar biosynthesis GTPase FlhF
MEERKESTGSDFKMSTIERYIIERTTRAKDFIHVVGPRGSGLTTTGRQLATNFAKLGFFVLE